MKKLLYLPLKIEGGAAEQVYLEKAFRKEFIIEVFDFLNYRGKRDSRFSELVENFHPDIIHCQFQGTKYIDPTLLAIVKLRYPKVVISQWTGDVREQPIAEVLEYGKYCDITFVNSVDDIKKYQQAGLRDVRLMFNAADAKAQKGKLSAKPQGIVFCGARYNSFSGSWTRIALVERFHQEFKEGFSVFGSGWPFGQGILPWEKQTEVYQNSYLILGHNNIETLEGWFSDRVFIAMASGRPFLCQYSRNLEKYFVDMREMVYWHTIDEAVEKAKWLLVNSIEARKIGKTGKQKVLAEHNWDVRVKEFIKHWEDYQ